MGAPRKAIKLARVQVQLIPSVLAWLRLEARRRDTSVSDVIRDAITQLEERLRT